MTPDEVADRVFGKWPTPEVCGNKGPRHLVCELDALHTETHQAQNVYGQWIRWKNESSQKQVLFGQEEFHKAEDYSASGT